MCFKSIAVGNIPEMPFPSPLGMTVIIPIFSQTRHDIKTDLGEIGWGCTDWIGLAQDRDKWKVIMNAAVNLRLP
jgi:hypothetical protein